MSELGIIQEAKKHLERDYVLALFMVRDLQVVEDMELSDMAWAMYQNYCVRSEVKWLLGELESHLKPAAPDAEKHGGGC